MVFGVKGVPAVGAIQMVNIIFTF